MDIKLSWLAGIVEGEGCFGLTSAGRYNFFQLTISITNTDMLLLEECKSILTLIGVKSRISGRNKLIPNRKFRYDLKIESMENMRNFIVKILPFMKSQKKMQAELMLSFLNRRIRLMEIHSGKSHRRIKYDEIDMSYLKAMHQLKNSEPVETARLSSQADDDTVRSANINKIADQDRNALGARLN